MSKLLTCFTFLVVTFHALSDEPKYIVEHIKELETLILNVDIKTIDAEEDGVMFDDVRDNDLLNLAPLRHANSYNLSLDLDFAKSDKLDFRLGKVILNEKLTEHDKCAIPDFTAPYSACLRYKVCKASTGCLSQYAIVYIPQKPQKPYVDIFVHAGKHVLTAAVKGDDTFEVGDKAPNFTSILDKSTQVRAISSSYDASHTYLIFDDGTAAGRGMKTEYRINFLEKYNYKKDKFGKPHPKIIEKSNYVHQYGCFSFDADHITPSSWRHFVSIGGNSDVGGTLGIDSKGDAYIWGYHDGYRYGQGYQALNFGRNIPCPLQVGRLSGLGLVQVEIGSQHGLGLANDGKLYSWGDDEEAMGRIINGSDSLKFAQQILASETFTDIAAGDGFSVVLTSTGEVKTFGDNTNGGLGRTGSSVIETVTFSDDMSTPGDLSDDYSTNSIKKISANKNNVLAIDANGFVWIWGTEYLGSGNSTKHTKPTLVRLENNEPLKLKYEEDDVYAGPNYQIVQTNAALYGWGNNKPQPVLGDKVKETGSAHPVVIFDESNFNN